MCNSSDFQEDWALDNCALGPNCQQTLSSAVLSTQPSHFDTDLRCYLHTEMVFFTWIFSFINHTWRDILHSFSFAKFILKSCE